MKQRDKSMTEKFLYLVTLFTCFLCACDMFKLLTIIYFYLLLLTNLHTNCSISSETLITQTHWFLQLHSTLSIDITFTSTSIRFLGESKKDKTLRWQALKLREGVTLAKYYWILKDYDKNYDIILYAKLGYLKACATDTLEAVSCNTTNS